MRFAKLSLERYGRFEDCSLDFRHGSPDLHIVYGANEAGKTTSMAAVSDLLFGFGTTSPYNFRFDYSLLRVGALIEEDNQSLAVRRRKANAGSLVGADDRPMDEGALAALLRGQTRDTFRLSFSLDQEGLRRGGRAMVQAKDDLGQALFAAGSNLTSVTAELHTLEKEADDIWGKRAAARRTYTAAERDYRDSVRSVRENALKPKEWTDARNAEQLSREALEALELRRNTLAEEGRRLQRLRRIAPFVRTRAALIDSLAAQGTIVPLGVQDEVLAEQALAALREAERELLAAQGLRDEVKARIDAIVVDDQALAGADRLDALLEERGAVTKAKDDLQRLETEHDLASRSLLKLREEAGIADVEVPGRLAVARLREIAAKAALTRAGLRELVETEDALRTQLADVDGRLGDAPPGATDSNNALRAAVELTRALGSDIDQRCADAAHAVTLADREIEAKLKQLMPWSGALNELRSMAIASPEELEEFAGAIDDAATTFDEESIVARRLADEASVLAIEIEGLQGGEGAVSHEELAEARADRERVWLEIRSDIALGALGEDALETATTYEGKVGEADELADRRYSRAEESGRLAQLILDRRARLLQSEQATARATEASKRRANCDVAWQRRLSEASLPVLSPLRFRAWLTLREEALEAASDAEQLAATAAREAGRREQAIAALLTALDESNSADVRQTVAPVLSRATFRLAAEDGLAAERLTLTAERKRIDQDLAGVLRRRQTLDKDRQDSAALWAQELADISLSFEMIGAESRLILFDEMRAATDRAAELDRRIQGIKRDAEAHATAVTEFATQLGITGVTAEIQLSAMRTALQAARSAQATVATLREDHEKRVRESDEAKARITAATTSLLPIFTALESDDPLKVGPAIEGSRLVRQLRSNIDEAEKQILSNGDGYALDPLLAAVAEADPDIVATQSETVERELADLNIRISEAAQTHGDARRAFAQLETESSGAIDAATDAAGARAEMEVQAEAYILRRVQAVTLRWAIERYRAKHQDPLLARASGLFSRLTLARYSGLRVDFDTAVPRLLGVSDDGRSVVEVGAMSEGTTDQLFLALRLAAIEQSVGSGVRLPFLADDLFVNFDDERARAGFEVLADLARSTQVLFFTHHAHLASIAREVVGAELHSECALA